MSAEAKRNDVADLLRRAKARIADPARWCQETYCDGEGRSCASWAFIRECEAADVSIGIAAREHLVKAAGTFQRNVITVNDVLGHDAVMQMYDRAIELAEAEADHE